MDRKNKTQVGLFICFHCVLEDLLLSSFSPFAEILYRGHPMKSCFICSEEPGLLRDVHEASKLL